MPLSREIPAPVTKTIFLESFNFRATVSNIFIHLMSESLLTVIRDKHTRAIYGTGK